MGRIFKSKDYIKNEIKANYPIIINNNLNAVNSSQNLINNVNNEEMKESKDNLLSLQKSKSILI
jgi:hypothetical protein